MSRWPVVTQKVLAIGEVARRSGLAASALRHYEAEGLLQPARDETGRRVYPRAVLRRVAFIRAAQAVGLSLAEIREAFERLPSSRTPTKADWAAVARAWAWEDRLEAQIAALTALKTGLTSCIGCGCLSLRTCRLTNPEDVSESYGAGAQYLPSLLRPSKQAQRNQTPS